MKCSVCKKDVDYVSTDLYYLDGHNSHWDGFIVHVVFKDKWTIQFPPGEARIFRGIGMSYFQNLLDKVVETGEDYFFACPECGDDVCIAKDGTLY